jgi:hypothetical protein
MHGYLSETSKLPRRSRQSPRRQHRGGQRAAYLRAWTAARLRSGEPIPRPTLTEAAILCGSSVPYIAALELVMQQGDPRLIDQILRGKIPLMVAANLLRKRGKLARAYRKASPKDRIDAVRALGPTRIFDEALVPAL